MKLKGKTTSRQKIITWCVLLLSWLVYREYLGDLEMWNFVGIWQNYEPFYSGGKALIHMGEVRKKISFKYDFDLHRNMLVLGFLIVAIVQLWCPCNYETELINIASNCLAKQLKAKMFQIEPRNDFLYAWWYCPKVNRFPVGCWLKKRLSCFR